MYKKYIGEGSNGKCYELSNGSILKIFKYPHSKSELERYKYFLNYKNDSIIFPHAFKIVGNNLAGYVTHKVPGDTIDKRFSSYNLEKMSKDIIELEKDILLISNGKIIMSDVHSSNILYDGNRFRIIDPDYYSISHLHAEEIFYKNEKRIKNIIFGLLTERISHLKHSDDILNELRKYCIYEYEINQMLLDTKNILEYYYNKRIDRLEDIGEDYGHMYIRNYRSRKN